MCPSFHVTCMAYSHDGVHIAIGMKTGQIAILHASSGDLVFIANAPVECVQSVEFSPDDRRVLWTRFGELGVSLFCGPERTHWHDCCLRMVPEEGWVKDDDGRLLLWIPSRYRDSIMRNAVLRLGPDIQESRMPTIDWPKLQRTVKGGWTNELKAER